MEKWEIIRKFRAYFSQKSCIFEISGLHGVQDRRVTCEIFFMQFRPIFQKELKRFRPAFFGGGEEEFRHFLRDLLLNGRILKQNIQ